MRRFAFWRTVRWKKGLICEGCKKPIPKNLLCYHFHGKYYCLPSHITSDAWSEAESV